jgi:hypothetical protein
MTPDHRVTVTGWDEGATTDLECLHGPDTFILYEQRLIAAPCRCVVDFPPGCEHCRPNDDGYTEHACCDHYPGDVYNVGAVCQCDPLPECWVQSHWDDLDTELLWGTFTGPPPWDCVTGGSGDEYPELSQVTP